MIGKRNVTLAAAAALVASATVPSFVHAANRYWDGGVADLLTNGDGVSGGTSGTWNTTIKNWDQGSGQLRVAWNNANGDTAILGGTAGTVTLGTPITAGGLQLNVTGYTIALAANNLTVDGVVTASGSQALTLSGASNSTTFFAGSTSNTLGGLITVSSASGGAILDLQKSGSARAIAGPLTIGTANNTIAQVKYTGSSTDMIGTGLVTINGRSRLDFNGATDTIGNVAIVSTGMTSQTSSIINTAGSGNLTIGSLSITPAAGIISTINSGASGTLTLGGTVTFTPATTGRAQIAGQTLNLGGATREFNVGLGTGANQDLQVVAGISGIDAGVTKTGAGRLALAGTNAYTGATTVDAGTLFISGDNSLATGAVAVNTSAVLGGKGTIGGAVSLNDTATLAPGDNLGALTVAALTLGATANTSMELGGTTLGTGYDNLTVSASGALNYGGNLSVANFGAYDLTAADATYDLFAFAGSTSPAGSFASVTVNSLPLTNDGNGLWTGSNGSVSYRFAQGTGDLTVSVPEPMAFFALATAGAYGLLSRRRAVIVKRLTK